MRGISFDVAVGEVFGLLGPNGAGKTTTVEILEGYRKRDGGEVDVLGFDPGRRRDRASASGSASCSSPSELLAQPDRARDAPRLRRLLRAPRDVDEVIELVGLHDKRDARVKTLSGGQKRRLDLGIALVGDPELVFLDEPTTGFDPAARRNAWELVRSLRGLGKTVLLTTHYLDEAQQLADRVAVLRAGEIVSMGRPAELIGAGEVEIRYRRDGETVVIRTQEPTRTLHDLTARRARRGARAGGARGATAEPRGRLPRAARRGRVVRLLAHQFRTEQLVFWRSREAAVFIFIFPTMLFLLLGSVYDGHDRRGLRELADTLLAGLIGYGAANTAFAGLAITLVIRREGGHAEAAARDAAAAAPIYGLAVLGSTLAVFFLQTLVLIAIGRVLFGAHVPGAPASRSRAVVVGALSFAGIGVAAAALDPLRRRCVGGRQRDRAADGVPLRLVRAHARPARRLSTRSATCCR